MKWSKTVEYDQRKKHDDYRNNSAKYVEHAKSQSTSSDEALKI